MPTLLFLLAWFLFLAIVLYALCRKSPATPTKQQVPSLLNTLQAAAERCAALPYSTRIELHVTPLSDLGSVPERTSIHYRVMMRWTQGEKSRGCASRLFKHDDRPEFINLLIRDLAKQVEQLQTTNH